MKAARLHAYGDVDQIHYDEIAKPKAGDGEVLVKVEASSLNPVELYLRQGYLAKMRPMKFPLIMGLDLSGRVDEVGANVSGYKPGDRVIGKLPINGNGSNTEFIIATPSQLAHLADNVSFAAGATLPLAGLTGRQTVEAVGAKKGDRVLVTGALGAVGRAAIQYLKEIGAVPVAGVRASRVAEAKAMGVEAIDIESTDKKAFFMAAIEAVGGPVAALAAALVRDGGKMAAVAGVPEGANPNNRIEVINVWAADKTKMLQEIADAAGRGDLAIPVAKTLKLSQVGEGHKLMAAGRVGGKIVFVP
jgi:NADPH:quinone reductase-like Zn-dependent oxidoreductase